MGLIMNLLRGYLVTKLDDENRSEKVERESGGLFISLRATHHLSSPDMFTLSFQESSSKELGVRGGDQPK